VWKFGDPANPTVTSTEAEPTYTYPNYGTYTVTLMTAPNAVCKDTITKSITLSEKILEAGFSYQYTDCDETAIKVRFFDESINNQFNTTGWLWEFSGVFNGTSTQASPTVVLTQEGTLNVKLTVTTAEGCQSSSAQQSLTIDFTDLGSIDEEVLGCLNGGVDLNPGGNPNYLYQWSPATGLSCNGCPDPTTYFNPHANPTQTTTYTLSVQNISADTCEIIKQVKVVVPPDVQLTPSPDVTTCNAQTTLTASSTLPTNLLWFSGGVQVGTGNSLTVNVSGVTTYTVIATDNLNCKYGEQVTVSGGPVDIGTSGDAVLCSNEPLDVFATNLDPNDNLSYAWSPAAAFNGPPTGPNPDVKVVPGQQTLTVTATNQFGCKKTDSLQVSVVDENLQLDFDHVVDCSGNQVKFNNLSTNAFNYVWDFGDPATNDDFSTAANPVYTYQDTGTYLVTLTIGFDVACADTVRKEVKIAETQFLVNFNYEYLDCSEDSIIVQFYDATALFVPSVSIISWHWETSNGQASDLQNPVFTVFAGETFDVTLTVFTSNDCSGSKVRSLKLEFIDVNLASTINLCQGDSTALNPASNGGYIYSWSPNLYLSDPNSPNPLAFPPVTTTYTVAITNYVPDTCTIVKTVTVFVPEKISVTASEDKLTCGEPVMLNAFSNVPATFAWSVGNNVIWQGASITDQPLVDTEYTVTGTDQYGCKDSTTVFVANEAVNAILDNPGKECPEVEVQLTVSNNAGDHTLSYVWSATPPGQILPPGNTATVAALTAPSGQSAMYAVVVTNQFGCKDTLDRVVSSYVFVPTVVQPGIQACAGVGKPLNPGADPGLIYQWSPPAGLSCSNCPNPIVTASQSTLYSVTVSDNFTGKICQQVFDVEVVVPPLIDIAETVDTFTCGAPIVIGATTNPAATLQWFDLAGNPLGTGATLTVNPVLEEKFIVVATDNFDCKATDTVVVSNNQLDLLLDGNGVIDTCPQPSYQICISNLDPNDLLSFTWTAGTGGQILDGGNTACPVVSSQTGQTTVFTAQVQNQWGCEESKTLSVLTHDFNPVTEDLKQICPGLPTELNPGGNASLNYQWSPPTGLSCTNCPNPVAILTENTTYTVSITGNFGNDFCSAVKQVQVNVSPPIDLAAQASDTLLCELKDVVLTAQNNAGGNVGFLWSESLTFSNPIGSENQVTVSPAGVKTYYVQATDSFGCKDTAQVTVNAFPINVSLADRFNFCVDNETITLSITNNDPVQQLHYTWQEQQYIVEIGPNGNPAIVFVDDTTTLHVLIKNQFGCTALDSATVFFYESIPDFVITSSKDTLIFEKGEFSQLNVPFDPTWIYEWTPPAGLNNPGINNPVASPDQTTEYTLLVSNDGGCFNGGSVLIVVINPECDEPNIFVPSAFTPNGDGENDLLYVRSNVVEQLEFVIYNRWGQKVFETTDQVIGWDGTFKNELLAPDVYAFFVKAKCFNGGEFFKKGNITLLR
jgi:gliding motility-associated-like protein